MNDRKIGKYQLRERLGKGGMGEVYKGVQLSMGRTVAIKLMHKHLADEPAFLERFAREAKGVAQLSHPNIVRIIDFDVEDGQYYMILEYVSGPTLDQYLTEHGYFSPEEALKVIAQLLDALGCAHEKGIIHRDIKPSNVIFTDATLSCPVLTDFGMARLASHQTMTASGAMIGTPAYMSPEALRGDKVDQRTDIYSLGVVLYEMLVGKKPYTSDSVYGIIFNTLHKPLRKPRQLNPNLPKVVEQLILKALSLEPEKRFQSAQAFYEAIQQTLVELRRKPSRSSLPVTTFAAKAFGQLIIKRFSSLGLNH
jgi:serine/threonine-protein kinase